MILVYFSGDSLCGRLRTVSRPFLTSMRECRQHLGFGLYSLHLQLGKAHGVCNLFLAGLARWIALAWEQRQGWILDTVKGYHEYTV